MGDRCQNTQEKTKRKTALQLTHVSGDTCHPGTFSLLEYNTSDGNIVCVADSLRV